MKLKKGMYVVVTPISDSCPLDKMITYLEKDKVVDSIQHIIDSKDVEVREAEQIEKEYCQQVIRSLDFEKISVPYEGLELYKENRYN